MLKFYTIKVGTLYVGPINGDCPENTRVTKWMNDKSSATGFSPELVGRVAEMLANEGVPDIVIEPLS